jgi:hypothetical protein
MSITRVLKLLLVRDVQFRQQSTLIPEELESYCNVSSGSKTRPTLTNLTQNRDVSCIVGNYDTFGIDCIGFCFYYDHQYILVEWNISNICCAQSVCICD